MSILDPNHAKAINAAADTMQAGLARYREASTPLEHDLMGILHDAMNDLTILFFDMPEKD